MVTTEQLYKIFLKTRSVCTDSRRVTPGSVFFALSGENFDGNNFAAQAIEMGCAYAVVDKPAVALNDKYLVVNNVLQALQDLARHHRKQLRIPVIAITGTNGKTTTKELISAILSKKFRVNATRGNMNNHIGVPLTILSMNHTTDMGVVEMGANHPGEIALLCDIAQPNYGLITNIGKAHLEGFGSVEAIIKTKAELYDYLMGHEGIIFLNNENPILKKLVGSYPSVNYGVSDESFCYGKITYKEIYVGVDWICGQNTGLAYSFLIGDYNFENILSAIAIGNYFNIAGSIIDKTISTYTPSNNRSQWVKGRRNQLILDLYNANPTSMMAAIINFNNYDNTKKCMILGDMLELGTDSEKEHHTILDFIHNSEYSDVYLVGSVFSNFKDKFSYHFFESTELLSKYFSKNPPTGYLILLKGSRGMKLEKCVDYL
ncbi:MAG: UDP-N-acetylmuramoyl-tripeptide--D-alanyl-D-alanine ligase [Bacteroidales bacterium]|nr:UDP-N-acetylmuramoyl-tripeptide--D-alanyl-D-alanine ligase [Bacteroidales bacterium]